VRRRRARSALPLKALRRRRWRLYCERGGRGVGCIFSSSGDPFFCFCCISYLPFKTSRAHAYMLQPEQNRGCNHKTHGVAIGARFGRIGCARPIFCGEASGPRAGGCARPTRGWMRDRPEWAWPVFVGRGGGRCFVVCAIAILIAPCCILASPCIYIMLHAWKGMAWMLIARLLQCLYFFSMEVHSTYHCSFGISAGSQHNKVVCLAFGSKLCHCS